MFAVKGGRLIMHVRRLVDVPEPLADVLASVVLALEEKLVPCCGRTRMWHSIPRSSATSCNRCLKTPCRHDAPASARRPGRLGPGSSGTAPHRIPHAVEAWHSSFATPEWFATLRHVGVRQSCSKSPRRSRCRRPPSPAPRAPTAGIAARRSPRRGQGGESPGRRRQRSEPLPTPENALQRGPSSGTSPGPYHPRR